MEVGLQGKDLVDLLQRIEFPTAPKKGPPKPEHHLSAKNGPLSFELSKDLLFLCLDKEPIKSQTILPTELSALDRLLYRFKNAHRTSFYFHKLKEVQKKIRLCNSLGLHFYHRKVANLFLVHDDHITLQVPIASYRQALSQIHAIVFLLEEFLLVISRTYSVIQTSLVEMSRFLQFAVVTITILSRFYSTLRNLTNSFLRVHDGLSELVSTLSKDFPDAKRNEETEVSRVLSLPLGRESLLDPLLVPTKPKQKPDAKKKESKKRPLLEIEEKSEEKAEEKLEEPPKKKKKKKKKQKIEEVKEIVEKIKIPAPPPDLTIQTEEETKFDKVVQPDQTRMTMSKKDIFGLLSCKKM
eukprot:TRINITY_DN176_c0_g1_i1.p1 TRINITY_DN176_c0_g1~~TRINITY_DN176_c0_g1_i1.p1  ORF type:complete len:353 (-),score=109.99 TRINITY_DN176_c0_g1_i1:34-1092(-)